MLLRTDFPIKNCALGAVKLKAIFGSISYPSKKCFHSQAKRPKKTKNTSKGLPNTFQPDLALLNNLTSRQKQVAKLAARGLTNQEIADELGISIKTAKAHISNALSLLLIDSRVYLPYFFSNPHQCPTNTFEELTPRQKEILEAIIGSNLRTYKQLAQFLYIEETTINKHLRNIRNTMKQTGLEGPSTIMGLTYLFGPCFIQSKDEDTDSPR